MTTRSIEYPAVGITGAPSGMTHAARPGDAENGFRPAMCDKNLPVSIEHVGNENRPVRALADQGAFPEFDLDYCGAPIAESVDCRACSAAVARWNLDHPGGHLLTWESVRDANGRRRVIYRKAMVDGRAVGAVSLKDEAHCPDIARPWHAWGYPLDGRPPGKGNTNLGWFSVRQAAEKAVKRHAAGQPTPREDQRA